MVARDLRFSFSIRLSLIRSSAAAPPPRVSTLRSLSKGLHAAGETTFNDEKPEKVNSVTTSAQHTSTASAIPEAIISDAWAIAIVDDAQDALTLIPVFFSPSMFETISGID